MVWCARTDLRSDFSSKHRTNAAQDHPRARHCGLLGRRPPPLAFSTFPSRCFAAGVRRSCSIALSLSPLAANADDELVEVYFGCGCFWHVQHEFVEAEKKILGRTDAQLTSRAGYAGGKAGMKDGKVCYHNAGFVSDYGSLGHAEVVGMKIPSSKFKEFAAEYCRLFDKNGKRPDQDGDRGLEYRNLVGVPGGSKSPYAKLLVEASIQEGDKLDFGAGKGDDADVKALSWVYDINEFPFYQAEPYHQFHDGFAWGRTPKHVQQPGQESVQGQGRRGHGLPERHDGTWHPWSVGVLQLSFEARAGLLRA